MIQVTAINNEKMWLDPGVVLMIGPLMDRGLPQLNRSVLYLEGLPPLPIKETRDEIARRIEEGIRYELAPEGESGADGGDERPAGGEKSRLVVS